MGDSFFSSSPETSSPILAAISRARSARLAYDEAVATDGVSARSWRHVAAELAWAAGYLGELVARGLIPAGYLITPGMVQQLADRAIDAERHAYYLDRMVHAARSGRVIDVEGMVAS